LVYTSQGLETFFNYEDGRGEAATKDFNQNECKVIKFEKKNQFSRVKTAVDGLIEDLVPGSALSDEFFSEFLSDYEIAVLTNSDFPHIGELFYYPEREDLVCYAPQRWHEIALLTRNSLLLRDEKQTISWEEQRKIFGRLVIGVVGASVGKNVFLAAANFLLPKHMKIADLRNYKDTNSARTQLSYFEIGRNKAEVAASQLHANNPYLPISVYSTGLNEGNRTDYICGNEKIGEPKIDYLIEETDDPDAKISGRIWARENRVPVIMVSDIGIGYQIDFRDFKNEPRASLAVGISDEELLGSQKKWHEDKANRELFFEFAFKLIGENWREIPEFADLVLKKVNVPFGGGIPQLGVAAFKGASDVATMIGMHELGYKMAERVFVDTRKVLQG
jgi:hypothetical protein